MRLTELRDSLVSDVNVDSVSIVVAVVELRPMLFFIKSNFFLHIFWVVGLNFACISKRLNAF